MSVWTKNLSPQVWPWLEPIGGLFLLFAGGKALLTGELHTRQLVFHGATCYVGGTMMVLASYLLFRRRLSSRRRWDATDRIVGICTGMGLLAYVILRWVDFFLGRA